MRVLLSTADHRKSPQMLKMSDTVLWWQHEHEHVATLTGIDDKERAHALNFSFGLGRGSKAYETKALFSYTGTGPAAIVVQLLRLHA